MGWVTVARGPASVYMVDFVTSGTTLELSDTVFSHAEGYDGLPDHVVLKAFFLDAE